ncbi:hypothetical protein ACNS7O_13420 [Haloferacaceae archaeon DSL9]
MTDRETDRLRRSTRTMADVSHTHPYTGETFSEVYRRGPAMADGGEERQPAQESTDDETMADVDHAPPHGDGANDVWARGDAETVSNASEAR